MLLFSPKTKIIVKLAVAFDKLAIKINKLVVFNREPRGLLCHRRSDKIRQFFSAFFCILSGLKQFSDKKVAIFK